MKCALTSYVIHLLISNQGQGAIFSQQVCKSNGYVASKILENPVKSRVPAEWYKKDSIIVGEPMSGQVD